MKKFLHILFNFCNYRRRFTISEKSFIFIIITFPSSNASPIKILENLIVYLDKIIKDSTKNFSRKNNYINTLQVFERIPLVKLIPIYKYISFFKIPIYKENFDKLINLLPNFFPFSSFKRILLFLIFI